MRGCTPLIAVDVAALVRWIAGVDAAQWQKPSNRPYVTDDPEWESLCRNTEPVVSKILGLFIGCRDTYRAITVTHPGDYVPPHTDTKVPGWVSRVHVPIVTNPHCWFVIDGLAHHMKVGMSYQVNPGQPHAVSNFGDSTRVHLMFDVIQ